MNYKFFILSLLISTSLAAQKRGTGLKWNDNTYQKAPLLPAYSGEKYNNIPLKISLRPYCPVPGDQQNTSTCVGWAVGYGALTIAKTVQAEMKNRDSINQVAHSAFYIYNRIADDCQVGADLDAALQVVKTEGDCLEKTFNNALKNCKKTPDALAKREAALFKIKDYAAVFNPMDSADVKIRKMRQLLAAKNPIVVGLEIGSSFWNIKNGDDYWTPASNEKNTEAHAMVVIGYDAFKDNFELMNSWGNQWGDGGFIRIKSADFARLVRYAYHIVAEDRALLRGAFSFQTIKNGGESFEDTRVHFNDNLKIYQTEQSEWRVGDLFQLIARNVPRGKYVYVYSLDARNQVHEHYPLSNNANFITSTDAEIIIPDAETALQIAYSGEDFLCILYADEKIDDFKSRLNQLATTKGLFYERFKTVFKDILIPENDVRYKPNTMQFEVVNTSKKGIVPIILQVKSR